MSDKQEPTTPGGEVAGCVCVVCTLPIADGVMRGMGDGGGQRFAHDACYWRSEADRLSRALAASEEARKAAEQSLETVRGQRDYHASRADHLLALSNAFADVAHEDDVTDLVSACGEASFGADGEAWKLRHATAIKLHEAWQDERSQRQQAEQDAERWHRLFDEGATLTAALEADRDRLAAELESMTESRDGWKMEAEQMYALIVKGEDPGYPRASLANGAVYAYDRLRAELATARERLGKATRFRPATGFGIYLAEKGWIVYRPGNDELTATGEWVNEDEGSGEQFPTADAAFAALATRGGTKEGA